MFLYYKRNIERFIMSSNTFLKLSGKAAVEEIKKLSDESIKQILREHPNNQYVIQEADRRGL